jgi:hypothetical protein
MAEGFAAREVSDLWLDRVTCAARRVKLAEPGSLYESLCRFFVGSPKAQANSTSKCLTLTARVWYTRAILQKGKGVFFKMVISITKKDFQPRTPSGDAGVALSYCACCLE